MSGEYIKSIINNVKSNSQGCPVMVHTDILGIVRFFPELKCKPVLENVIKFIINMFGDSLWIPSFNYDFLRKRYCSSNSESQ